MSALVDSSAELLSADCLICAVAGERVTARFLDREGGPVCACCKASLVRIEVQLRLLDLAAIAGGRGV